MRQRRPKFSSLAFAPPYFPEPVVVPQNVASDGYDARLSFVRRVILVHALTVAIATALAIWLPIFLSREAAIMVLLGSIALLSAFRKILHGKIGIAPTTILATTAIIVSASQVAQYLERDGWPVMVLPLGVLGGLLYTIACGRDFSFVGQFVLAGLFTVLGCFGIAWAWPGAVTNPGLAGLFGVLSLLYYVYDLAMILKRRKSEEWAYAVADLYCDTLNVFTYLWRVVQHWRKMQL
ncbi:MAG: hypothetical protein J0L72_08815 [Armatimonadetes bacterium]|nr:hypothetical protein [Armatimonadota bacterium]